MTGLVMYEEPFPAPDSVVPTEGGEKMCLDLRRGFQCTREPGHAGVHQACNEYDRMVASWGADR